VYLPRDEMAAHGVTESMLRVGVVTAEFASLMRAQIARSRQYYRDAAALLPEADRLALIPAETMRRIYSGLLDRVERVGLDVFRHRVRMSKLGKVGCGVAAWAAANWANWKGRIRR
jgi:phytoene synthase